MLLDKFDSDYLNALLLQINETGQSSDLCKAMYHDTTVSATTFNRLRQMILDAETAYNATPSNLHLTDANGDEYLLTADNFPYQVGGIGHFPHPPSK